MASVLDGKPIWVGILIGLALIAAAVGAVHYFLVIDIEEEIKGTESQIAELDKKIQQGRAAQQKLPQFREEVRRLEIELEKLRRILPSTRNTEEIIRKLKSLVDQGDFILRRLSFPDIGAVNGSDPYAEWPISVEVDGRYHNLAILYNRLSNFSRIINVERVNINALPTQVDRTITVSFVAKTFVYVEAKDTTGDKKKAGKTK
jgi:type IV pilus assembly protein PilO